MTTATVAFGAMAGAHLAGALLSMLAPSARAARAVTTIAAVLGSLAGLAAAGTVLVSGEAATIARPALVAPAGGVLVHLDPLGALFLALVSAGGALATAYGAAYASVLQRHGVSMRAFGASFNGFLLGMALVPAAGNVFTFLLAWELMALTSYLLVMTEHRHEETRHAGLWYAAMTHLGLVLLLPMFLLLAPSPAATTFADLRSGAAALTPGMRSVVFVLALVAFGSKAGAVPLHVWLPRAHPAAPSHVSALMSGVMVKLGIYGLVRIAVDVLGQGPAWWGALVLLAGSVSALVGVLYALADNDLKRLLAYSTVENVGIILLGLGAGLVLRGYGLHELALAGFAAALLHAVNHAAFKTLLFFGAGNVLWQAGTRNIERMGGLVKGMPLTAATFLVGAAAAAGLPPLNGFASEWMIFQSLLAGARIPPPAAAVGPPLAIGVLALTSGLAAACFVKAFGISFLAMPRSPEAAAAREPSPTGGAVLLVTAAACVALGLAAPWAFARLSNLVAAFGTAAALPPAGASGAWLLSPAGLAQVSPAVIGVLLASVMAVSVAALRAGRLRVRYTDTWGCGRIRQTARMEYTSSAFAEPLRRIFSELYRPSADLSVSAHPASPYHVRAITYTARVSPWFEKALYDPIVRATVAAGTQVRRLQAGSVHLYLLYVVAALMAALAAAWWLR